MSQVCDSHLFDSMRLKSPPTPGSEFAEILRELAPDDSMLFCKFKGQFSNCESFFNESITDEGICSTFNLLQKNDGSWSPAKGYASESFDSYPHRAFEGSNVGLNVVLTQKSSELEYKCKGPVQGWRVKIHSPDEFPSMSTGFVRVPFHSETTIVVKPEVIKSFGQACHTKDSKVLKYSKEYSQENCKSECLSSFVLLRCGCSKFSMIHDDESSICTQHKTKCVSSALDEFSTTFRYKQQFSCDCKPSCDRVKYNTNAYQAHFDFKNVFAAFEEDLEGEFPKALMSRLTVYVDEDFYVPKATPTKSFISIVANIGGILAFFLGASWISIIEVFYYFVKRFRR